MNNYVKLDAEYYPITTCKIKFGLYGDNDAWSLVIIAGYVSMYLFNLQLDKAKNIEDIQNLEFEESDNVTHSLFVGDGSSCLVSLVLKTGKWNPISQKIKIEEKEY